MNLAVHLQQHTHAEIVALILAALYAIGLCSLLVFLAFSTGMVGALVSAS